uniref:G_PROTEIN_RECEP_F1_2 domain-containing protein n=1 Tax=Steinernema glaseri TaxID=37863 RepID=A0A1I7XXA9_9BILA
MDDELSYFYNRILDFTALGSITTKPLCMYIIITKTPKYMRTVSYFIFNELFWNFVGNLLFTLGHVVPMMPALCYRMDGLISYALKSEVQRSMYFIAIVITVVNCCLGFVTTFIYRFVTLAFGNTISRFYKYCGYVNCVAGHFILAVAVAFLFKLWMIPVNEYPIADLPEKTENLFCYRPEGLKMAIVMYSLLTCFGGTVLIVTLFAGLSIRELWIKRHHLEKKTISMQKEVQNNLLIITGAAILVGGLPLLVHTTYVTHSKWPFAREIVSASVLISLNYGTIYAILVLFLFKSYRKVVLGRF